MAHQILYVTGYSPFPFGHTVKGGTQKTDILLVEGLARQGHNIHMVSCLEKSLFHPPWRPDSNSGLISHLHIPDEYALVEYLLDQERNFDICHVSSRIIFNKSELATRLGTIKIPIVYSLTGNQILSEVTGDSFKNCKYIACFSSELANLAINIGVPKKKIKVVYSAIDPVNDQPLVRTTRLKLRNQFGITLSDMVFISAGRISQEKCLDRLVRIWLTIRDDMAFQKSYLFILGEAHNKNLSMMKFSSQLKDMKRHGIISPGWVDIRPYLCASDFAVFTSRKEGMSNVALEAAAQGVPSIGPRQTPGFSDLIIHGKTGYLYDIESDVDLINQISASLQFKKNFPYKYEKMSQDVRKLVNKKFVIDKVIFKYQRIYQAALLGGR